MDEFQEVSQLCKRREAASERPPRGPSIQEIIGVIKSSLKSGRKNLDANTLTLAADSALPRGNASRLPPRKRHGTGDRGTINPKA